MALDLTALTQACFEFALATTSVEDSIDHMLARTKVDTYVAAARQHEHFLLERGRDPNLLTYVVRYLTQAHAIPPLSGDLVWFNAAIDVMVDLACPNSLLDRTHEQLIHEMELGFEEARRDYQV
ncbi:MAG: hypothetical protein JOY60_06840 [Burkholderiaceae bacterium]|nr:hypothetical protein [Roseateles sp.]MBV8469561.1 hypothetical protein [Burkholderiaceae bacterium]